MKQIFVIAMLVCGAPALAQSTQVQIDALKVEIENLKKSQDEKNQAMIDEVSRLSAKLTMPDMELKSFHGMGPGASKVYYNPNRLSLGGYGEVKFKDPRGGANTTDVHRFIPYLGYRFADNIIFNAEIEFEHGGAYKGDHEAIVEFAYVDFLVNDPLNFRVGHVLVPMGLTNLKHEPINFASVNRPEIEKVIIPSTWHENGVLVFGSQRGLSYSLGVINGLNIVDDSTLEADSWIRGARQRGAKAAAEELAYVFSTTWGQGTPLEVGASYYTGNSAQALDASEKLKVDLWEAHFIYQLYGFEWRGLYTSGQLDGAETVSTSSDPIGEKVSGYYTSLSYDIARFWGADYKLPLSVRHSQYNLNEKVGEGFTAVEDVEKTITTFAVNYLPHPNVVLKADYQLRDNESETETDLFQLGLGFVF